MGGFNIQMEMTKGKRLSKEGRHEEALAIFVAIANISDRYHAAYYHAGLEMIALGMFEKALEKLDILTGQNPEFVKALFWRCLVLIILGKDDQTDGCFEKLSSGLKGHHHIYQFKAMREKGYQTHIRPDLKSDKKSVLALDTSICAEVLGIGDRYHTPQILVFLMGFFERVVVTETVLAEIHDLVERKNLQADSHVQEVLALLEAVLVKTKVSPNVLDGLVELYKRVIADMCDACLAWWSAKGRRKVRVRLEDGRIILPDADVLKALFWNAVKDRVIAAEAEAAAAGLSCMAYLVTADFDHALFAAEIYEITGKRVMPVRPEQIMWNL